MNCEWYLLKVRKKTASRGAPWYFVGMEGRLERLRVHACQYKAERIEEVARLIVEDNPEYETKKVPA